MDRAWAGVCEREPDVSRGMQVEAHEELERQYNLAIKDPEFIAEVARSGRALGEKKRERNKEERG